MFTLLERKKSRKTHIPMSSLVTWIESGRKREKCTPRNKNSKLYVRSGFYA